MISRRIFAAVALLCALVAPAHAQKTKAQITTEIGTLFPNNTSGAITPTGLRTVTTDIINSIMPTAPVGDGNFTCFSGTTGLLKDCGGVLTNCPLADNTGVTNATAAIQACLDTKSYVQLRDGTYRLTDKLTLNSNQTLVLSSGTTLRQYTPSTQILYAPGRSNVTIKGSGALLQGEGTYCGNPTQAVTAACPSGAWTGQTSSDKAIDFLSCSFCSIDGVHTRNNGAAGIAIFGGTTITVSNSVVEGTNLYSTPVLSNGNFQNGVFLREDPTNGPIKNLLLANVDISGSAQGILREVVPGVSTASSSINGSNIVVHDITGQHALYNQGGQLSFAGFTVTNVELSAAKTQIADSAIDAYNVFITGIVARNIRGQVCEVAHLSAFAGSLNNVICDGEGYSVGRALSVDGLVRGLKARLQVDTTTGEAAYFLGAGMRDIDVTLRAKNVAVDCVLVVATDAFIRIRADLHECNTSNTGRFGAYILSPSANVTFDNPIITDANALTVTGIVNGQAGSDVKVLGSAKITGMSGYCASATGTFSAWPIWTTLSCATASYSGASNITQPAIGDVSVPFGGLFLRDATTINWGAGDITILGGSNQLTFQGAANGYNFDGGVLPTVNAIAPLGYINRGWAALYLGGATSGYLVQTPPAIAGTTAINWGTASGTPAVTASGPLAISSTTGNITCTTCVTSSGGGAITGTAPIAVSAGGVVSINAPYTTLTASNGGVVYSDAANLAILAGTASAGQMLRSGASTAPTWSTAVFPSVTSAGTVLASLTNNNVTATNAPVLGAAGGSTGQIGFSGITSGTATITAQPTAGSPILILPNASGTFAVSAAAPLALSATTGAVSWTGAALTKTDDTNVTLTLGGSPTSALGAAASLTLGWTGQLGLTRGGTAASLTASNGGIAYSTASALAILAGTATANLPLVSGSSAAPSWATVSHPSSAVSGGIPYFSSTTVMGTSALLAANQIMLGGGAATAPVTLGSLGTTTTVLHGNAGGPPSFSAVSLNTDVSGTLQAAQEPAHTGDVTNSAGSLALSLVAGNAGNLNSGTLLAARMPALTGACTTSAGAVATTCTINTTIQGGGAVNTILAGATGWVGVGLICNSSEAPCNIQQPQIGTISNFYVGTNVAPGAGQTYTVTMRKNASNQTVTCTISGAAATTCNDTTHSFSVAAADNVTVQIVSSGAAATVAVANFGYKLATTSP
jgi:hypothetical protein